MTTSWFVFSEVRGSQTNMTPSSVNYRLVYLRLGLGLKHVLT